MLQQQVTPQLCFKFHQSRLNYVTSTLDRTRIVAEINRIGVTVLETATVGDVLYLYNSEAERQEKLFSTPT